MIRLGFIFLLLLASIWLGLQLQHDPGYVLIAIGSWTLESTLWVALCALFILVLLMYCTLTMLAWIIQRPTAWKNWAAKRRSHLAQKKTRQGLIEFSEGYWLEAKNHLIKALPGTDTPLLNYLTAARAAQEMGDNRLRDDYLRRAQQSMPEAKIAVELTQAQLQLANRQWEQALATLKHLHHLAPNHPYVLKLLMHLYEEVRDWPQLISLLPELKRNQIISGDDYRHLEQHTYLQAMADLMKHHQATALYDLFASLPKRLRDDPDIITTYCQFLIDTQKQYEEAERLLRRSLSKQFNESLIALYGKLKQDTARLDFIESFLKKHPHSAALFLCLARLSQAQNLWGKAKTYLEKSITLNETREAYYELGELLEYLNDEHGACKAYQQGLKLSLL